MALRKKKRSEEAQTARSALKAKDAGVKRRTRSSDLPPEYTGLEQLPNTPKVGVKRFKNGLVNLTKPPKHLLEKYTCLRCSEFIRSYVNQGFRAQRNATESPILRLPSDIRSIIWTLAVEVDLVFIERKRNVQCATGYGVAFDERGILPVSNRQLSAFHLPEVCRQIYAEAATLAYSTNTFLLYHWALDWTMVLSFTQLGAITRVELGDINTYLLDFECCVRMASLKNKGLVKLTHCHISTSTQKKAMRRLHGEFRRLSKDRESWVRLITDAVKFQEGQHMVG
jgi:hypothetical protein